MARVVFLLMVLAGTLRAQEYNLKNAGDYNNYIMEQMRAVVRKNYGYLAFQVHSESYDSMEIKRKEVIEQVRVARRVVAAMPPMEEDTKLRDESLLVLEEYEKAFDLDYGEVLHLKRKSKDSYQDMLSYFSAEDKAEAKLNGATLKLQAIQREYAHRNNLRMGDADEGQQQLSLKMTRAREVNKYWRTIFAEYFRAATQYDHIWEVMPMRKATVLERARKDLLSAVWASLPRVKDMPHFNGDTEFRDETVNVLQFFERVAQNQMVRVATIFQKPRLTQEDIDEINGLITYCNSSYELIMNNWNNASEELFRWNIDAN